ncbi:MAG: 30S ribosomal protein S12 methylthiotransferase RimO [Rhodocyclaceae bacterium]|nr:30S ribosomal protein S12 methylthiotransferase RimO [Rhodocyclaceae bacterium]
MKPTPSVGFVSLGCPKATVDSEHILTRLRAEGYGISADYDGADLVIVNTCGFIDAAVEESLDAIGEALTENGKVIVTGCLGARDDVILAAHPHVLEVTGPHATEQVMQAVHRHLPMPHDPFVDLVPAQGIRLTPDHYAYLKISEGCNHRCSFCIIPSMRGDLVSRPVGDVLREAEKLVEAGVQELLVISQDTSAYGVDLKYRTGFWGGRPVKTRLYELCESLASLGVWIRLHYVYPYPSVDDLIPLMAEGKVLPYLDVPFQHASPRILKQMKRPASSENVLARVRRWREICPDIAIRSTFITGFPGETEEDFEHLLAFLDEARLDRVGAFAYSPVEGAAANALPDPVPADVAEDRRQRLMEFQEDISTQRLEARIGREYEMLVDDVDEEGAIGRTPGEAPEIDGLVIVPNASDAEVGQRLRVRITDCDVHDLYAERIG